MSTALSISNTTFDVLIGAIVGILWAILAALEAVGGLLFAHWRPVATAAGIVGAVVGCVLCPMLPLGLAITAAVAWVTYPRTAVRA